MEKFKKLEYKNEKNHRVVFSMWAGNKVHEDDILYPMEPGETRTFRVRVQDRDDEVFMQEIGDNMIIPHYRAREK